MLEASKTNSDGGVIVVKESNNGVNIATASVLTVGSLLIGGAVVGLFAQNRVSTLETAAQASKDGAYNAGFGTAFSLYGTQPIHRKPLEIAVNNGSGTIV